MFVRGVVIRICDVAVVVVASQKLGRAVKKMLSPILFLLWLINGICADVAAIRDMGHETPLQG